jgi:hypothetical protein
LVDTDGGGGVLGVGSNKLEGLLELGGSELEFGLGSIGFTVGWDEAHELVVGGGEGLVVEELGLFGLVGESDGGDSGGGTNDGSGPKIETNLTCVYLNSNHVRDNLSNRQNR